jgi:glycerol-3-phosphate cytidylyltransferase
MKRKPTIDRASISIAPVPHTTVYTVGTFDLLHVGHIALLQFCRTLGDVVVAGVASDDVVNSYKPNVPVIPLEQRQEMLKSLRCVDIVWPYYELEYVSACIALDVDVFVVGEDWGRKPHNLDVERYLKARGKKVVQARYSPRTSSTTIKQLVRSQPIKGIPAQQMGTPNLATAS